MRLYTHTHTSVLTNRKKEVQEKAENINAASNLWKANSKLVENASVSTDYVNAVKEELRNNVVEKGKNNKVEQKEKKIKKEKGKLQKVSCLLVMRKIIVAVVLMIIVLAILVGFGVRYNWKIENIIEEIGKVINIKGTGAEIEEVAAMDMTKIDLVPDKNQVNVPVPKGYVLSGASDENDVTKGAVIYEGTTAVTDANVATEKTTRNQFVWVPVSAANVSRIYAEDEYGRKSGKMYEYTTTGRTEGKTTSSGYKYFEPRILEDYNYNYDGTRNNDKEETFQKGNLYGYSQNGLYEEMQKNYEETIESIKAYGGFYIGRYETGNLSQRKPAIVQYNEDISNQEWYTMYSKVKYIAANNNVKTMMIYGSLWDETLMWFVESKARSYQEIVDSPDDWGNYLDAEFSYYTEPSGSSVSEKRGRQYGGKLLPTGVRTKSSSVGEKRNCTNNIYDISGNCAEATQAAEKRDYGGCFRRAMAGGYYKSYGFQEPPSYFGNGMETERESKVDYCGTRTILIIV